MNILGISAAWEPSAACLVRDGRILAAVQESRYSRLRADQAPPRQAIGYCLRTAKMAPEALDAIAVVRDASGSDVAPPDWKAAPRNLGGKVRRLFGRPDSLGDFVLGELGADIPVETIGYEEAHAGAAFYPSPFEEATILLLLAGGQRAVVARGHANGIEIVEEIEERDEGDPVEVAVRLVHRAHRSAPHENLVIAGPGAGRRATNGRLARAGVFSECWVQPASATGASAIGAAFIAARARGVVAKADRAQLGFGPGYNAAQVRTFLRSQSAVAEELGREDFLPRVAEILLRGDEIGWFQGRLDIGDDIAGSRSILRAPGAAGAPPPREGEVLVLPRDHASEYLECGASCPPLVELVLRSKWREQLGDPTDPAAPRAVTTIDRRDHRVLASLLEEMERRTGMAALAARPLRPLGEPVACGLHDGWNAFFSLDLETLVMAEFLLEKSKLGQPASAAQATAGGAVAGGALTQP